VGQDKEFYPAGNFDRAFAKLKTRCARPGYCLRPTLTAGQEVHGPDGSTARFLTSSRRMFMGSRLKDDGAGHGEGGGDRLPTIPDGIP